MPLPLQRLLPDLLQVPAQIPPLPESLHHPSPPLQMPQAPSAGQNPETTGRSPFVCPPSLQIGLLKGRARFGWEQGAGPSCAHPTSSSWSRGLCLYHNTVLQRMKGRLRNTEWSPLGDQPGKWLSHSSSLSLKCLGLGPDLNHFLLYLPSLLSLKKEARRVPERG